MSNTVTTCNQQILLKEEVEDLQIEFELVDTQTDKYNSAEIAEIDDRLAENAERIKDLDAEIDRLTNHADGLDYTVAVAVGILTGLIDSFFCVIGDPDAPAGDSETWKDILGKAWEKELGKTDDLFNKFVMKQAGVDTSNYDNLDSEEKKKLLQNAIRELENKYPLPSDDVWKKKGDGNSLSSTFYHHIEDFCHHPTAIGFLSCLISEFFKVAFFVDEKGKWHFTLANTKKEDMIWLWGSVILTGLLHWLVSVAERKYSETQQQEMPKPLQKILRLLVSSPAAIQILMKLKNWLGHLCSDIAGSSNATGRGMGIPGIITAQLKELAAILPIPGFNEALNSYFYQGFDFRAESTIMRIALKQAVPVITNEILVRGFYFVRRLIGEAQEHGTDWNKYDWQKTLPFNNRTIVRMLTISHGTFVAVDLADAAIRTAVSGQYTDPATFLARMALRVNFVGLGRFTIAVYSDVKMGFQRRYKVAERMKLHSEMLHLYNAKLFYKQENMWIEAKNAELATREVYEAAVYSVKYFFQAFERMDIAINKIDPKAIDTNNPGLLDKLKKMLK